MTRLWQVILTAGLICLAGSAGESAAQSAFGPGGPKGQDPAFELNDKALGDSIPNPANQRSGRDPCLDNRSA